MAGKKIIQLPSLGRNLIGSDLLEVSVNGTGSYKITGQEIMNASSVFWGDIQGALSNQTDVFNAIMLAANQAIWGGIGGDLTQQNDLQSALNSKQSTLVSGVNIATINYQDLTLGGNINTANLISENNHFPFYDASTYQFLNSNLYYEGGDTSRLYHKTNIFGNIIPNFILDGSNGYYQIGAKDNIDWPNPQTGINFNVYNNTFALTVGSAYNPKLNYFDNSFYIMGGSNNLAMISLNDYGAALQHQMGVASMYGSFGVNIDGAQGNVQIQGFNVFMNSQTGIGMYTDKLQFWNANMFDSGTKTQTNKYFKITDENGVEYWVPMYQ